MVARRGGGSSEVGGEVLQVKGWRVDSTNQQFVDALRECLGLDPLYANPRRTEAERFYRAWRDPDAPPGGRRPINSSAGAGRARERTSRGGRQ